MDGKSLLFVVSLLLTIGAKAQLVDVTNKYIPNAGFEECEPLPTTKYHDKQLDVDIDKTEVWSRRDTPMGTDYSSSGWKLVEQLVNGNGGVVIYGVNIQTGQYATAGEPGPEKGITGDKGLCFSGNNGLVYQQTNEVSLPKGYYKLTLNIYARNGQTTGKGETVQVVNIKTGFMPTGGDEEDLVPAERKSVQFPCDGWTQDVIEIELTKPATGRFQISYGTTYYVVVDDVKLEYYDGVITTALSNVLVKAKALNAELNSNTLSEAIAQAEAFIAAPTDQDDVDPQVDKLKEAMTTALKATTKAVNITAAYLENPSFEEGDNGWEAFGTAQEPINELSLPYIDGKNIYDYTSSGSNTVYQTLADMPAGYYMLDAKLNKDAKLVINSNRTDCTGGLEHMFLRVHSVVLNQRTAGQLKIGSTANLAYKIDDFRLFYAKDEASLLALELESVKAEATAVLNDAQFESVTGSERTNLANAINGTDIAAINTAINNVVTATVAYPKLTKAKQNAAAYTLALYPYAVKDYYDQIQTLINTEATTAKEAFDMATQLDNLCFQFYVSNFYCEGVENTDYTQSVGVGGYAGSNMAARTDAAAWKDPKTNVQQTAIYGVSKTYPSQSANNYSAFFIPLSTTIPEGTYVFSVMMMGSTGLTVDVCKNDKRTITDRTKIGVLTGQGTAAGGKYGAGWNDYAVEFQHKKGENYIILYCMPTENFKEWYVANFRLYHLTNPVSGISTVRKAADNVYYDLQGRRVAQPQKGLYIVNGKKVYVK